MNHKERLRECRLMLPELASMPKADFLEWLAANEKMYSHFLGYARQALNAGRTRFSVYMIRERVRWYVNIEYQGEFKISNNLTPYLARALCLEIPELREVLSMKGPQKSGNQQSELWDEI